MPRAQWPLVAGRPSIEIELALVHGAQPVARTLIADTGAGRARSRFELILDEDDCLLCGGPSLKPTVLGGAYVGQFPVYLVQVRIPLLEFNTAVPVVGVPSPPAGFDGIACFRFLNRFNYGNFADPNQFGLETR